MVLSGYLLGSSDGVRHGGNYVNVIYASYFICTIEPGDSKFSIATHRVLKLCGNARKNSYVFVDLATTTRGRGLPNQPGATDEL